MQYRIPYNIPPLVGGELENMRVACEVNHKICGDGPFTKECTAWLQEHTGAGAVLLTTSCSHAMDMTAFLMDIQPGDEVILPSFTFVSTANAFVLRGGVPVFVDIRPDTMNIDEKLIEEAITEKTKAIAPVHYAGVGCEMDTILKIAKDHHLYVMEDAAQGMMATYKGRALGTMGDFGAVSFHETKNYSMGEGGALYLRDKAHLEEAEILREKGTNRSQFFRGQVDKYRWMNFGSSYLPGELNAAYLKAQLDKAEEINKKRIGLWEEYYELLSPLAESGRIELPTVPEECVHNGHIFYIKVKDLEERSALIEHLGEKGILAVFHYVPLHSAPAGKTYGRFHGEDRFTTKESERLLRLPLYYALSPAEVEEVVKEINAFYKTRG
ncbi:MAG: dTDP-4-amino-4,6-dideoxygalactose transaminase [Lachnospiraceae bacterium]|nr:dTDP-4-amino-4,6-dideoxygalactose transaminase [Lachnospiraceae bacterium]